MTCREIFKKCWNQCQFVKYQIIVMQCNQLNISLLKPNLFNFIFWNKTLQHFTW